MELALLSKGEGLQVLRLTRDKSAESEVCLDAVLLPLKNTAGFEWSADGSHLASWRNIEPLDVLYIHDAHDWSKAPLQITTTGPIRSISWSRTGRFVRIHSTFGGPSVKNVQVLDVSKGNMVLELSAKPNAEGQIAFAWGANDACLCRATADALCVYDLRDVDAKGVLEPFKLEQPGIMTIATAPERRDGMIWISFFVRGMKGMASQMKLASIHMASKEIRCGVTKALMKIQECEFDWNSNGQYVVARTHIEVDESGKSYYGTSALFLLEAKPQGKVTQIVGLDCGPVQAAVWSSTEPKTFAVVHGKMPSQIHVYDATDGNATLDLGEARRNYMASSPCGQLFLVAGFGNLPGDLEVWDMRQGEVAGLARVPWTVSCAFSPDSYWILSATTTPRLRVDNGIRLLRLSGELVFQKDIEELYRACWRPMQMEPCLLSPGRKLPAIKKDTIYQPKGASAAQASPTRQLVAKKIVSGGKLPSKPLPPGCAAEETAKSKARKKKASSRPATKPVADLEFVVEEFVPSATTAEVTTEESASPSLEAELNKLPPEALEKRLLKVKKLIGEMEALATKKKLDVCQQKKLARMEETQKELSIIESLLGH